MQNAQQWRTNAALADDPAAYVLRESAYDLGLWASAPERQYVAMELRQQLRGETLLADLVDRTRAEIKAQAEYIARRARRAPNVARLVALAAQEANIPAGEALALFYSADAEAPPVGVAFPWRPDTPRRTR